MFIRLLCIGFLGMAVLAGCKTNKAVSQDQNVKKEKPVVENGRLPEVKATAGEGAESFKDRSNINDEIKEEIKLPVLEFNQPEVDFGTVKKGEKRRHSFAFTNTGNADLVIELVTACTCTSLDWPREPIPPGGTGSVDIEFDSSSKDGMVSVDVDVIANTEPIVVTAVIRAAVIN